MTSAALPSTAAASITWWYSGALATWSDGTVMYAHGVQADSFLFAKQTGQQGDWVNSLYARQDDGDFFEAGWYWPYGGSNRIWFSKRRIEGVYFPEQWFSVPGAVTGDWARIRLTRVGTSGDMYAVYVNDILRQTVNGTGIQTCRASLGAERYDTLDTNRGSWTYVMAQRVTDNAWVWWQGIRNNQGTGTDPYYVVWDNDLNRSDHFLYSDTHPY